MTQHDDSLTLDLFIISPSPPGGGAGGEGETPPPPAPPDEPPKDYLPLGEFAERCYLSYAMSVVLGRALPHVEDGMKPVQRRILYSMREMGLSATTKHVKSARVVGDVIGKLHPHGDQSVYDAMVRMAQGFTLRYPLIDGQGNFGSRDGDGAAAMRYTESRLTPIAELLLAEIDAGTVDFKPNYDGAFKEPVLLPARLPLLLANGASGIAVGMATEIPSHNLRELADAAVHVLKHPEATTAELIEFVHGPDFPGGGQIISSPADIRAAYETGRGSLRVRARWQIEPLARGQWRVVVTELPPGVSTAQVLTQIDALTNPQIKTGKKELSQEQKTLKAALLAALETVRDESDEKAPVRIVLEPQSRNQDPDSFMRLLLAQTSLETTAPMNLTVVGRDGRPGQKGLAALIGEWASFRVDTVRRRTEHRLDAVNRRIHILEGRQAVLLNIDEVIRVIREADDPKADLMAAFDLSEIQADDILEIRLRQLARLEGIKIEKELGELRSEKEGLLKLLGDEGELKRLVISEIRADAKKYGDERRTLIETAQAITASSSNDTIVDEPVTVIVSKNGWLRARTGHGLDAAAIQYKAGDSALAVLETRTTWPLLLLDSAGRSYALRIPDLPTGRGDGVPLATLAELAKGERLLYALSAAPDTRWLIASNGGYGFLCHLSDLVSKQRAGKAFLTLEPGWQPLPPARLSGTWVAVAADNGKLLAFPLEEMKILSGGKGVQLMKLEDNERLLALTTFDGQRLQVEGKTRLGRPANVVLSGEALEKHRLRRARKGQVLERIVRVEKLDAVAG
ncbi:MAG: DNA topoisomerase IV subunit A [Pseudomonadota bacterium]|nr:DNA topoisomerase IV subunit A [Pseudomonadota bacterium]MDP1906441.1 DNA topoisomerase IV subunit A [Pseudomonadota bacterium]MDP2351286.1 DNA topoisomerase IV subunit A [Pseudomonadota bacterium]